jgi:hypothetical protein
MNKTQFRKTKIKTKETKKRRTGGAKTHTTKTPSAVRSAPYSITSNPSKPSKTATLKNKKEQCKYDPFCYQTNPHHTSQYTHTPMEKIDVEDVISKLINEKHNGDTTTLYDAVIKWSHAKLESKNLTPSQLKILRHLHTRIQEEALPNMRTLGEIMRYSVNKNYQ